MWDFNLKNFTTTLKLTSGRNSHSLRSWSSISPLLIINLHPSFEQETGAKLHCLTWSSRTPSSTTSWQPLWTWSQVMFKEDNISVTILGGCTKVSGVNSSRQVGHLCNCFKCLEMHGVQKRCWFRWHWTGCLKTLRQIGQCKFLSTSPWNLASSNPFSTGSI